MSYVRYIENLKKSVEDKDKEKTVQYLTEYMLAMKENPELINWIITPSNITELHKGLIESFGVIPRAMMLNKRVSNRSLRATLFIKAMLNGMSKLKE